MTEVIDECLTWVADMALDRGISIDFEPELFDELHVLADATKLKQAVLNLLSNAVKYNRENGQVRVICEKTNNGLAKIGISDTGPGLSEDQINELFQPFRRLGAEHSSVEGTGIGLVITRKLIRLMHGHVDVDSSVGKGSTFWIALPSARGLESEDSAHAVNTKIGDKPTMAVSTISPQILVAEDNQVNRELISAQMEHLQYQTDVAENGAEALRLWQSGKYKLLITDIRMAVMDGYELIKQIRSKENGGGEPSPIIVMSANAMGDDVKRCFEAGANDVLCKPIKIRDLRTSIQKWWPGIAT